ncbi:MAG: FkbM family methyltransferase [Saprospiraceae bacterium]
MKNSIIINQSMLVADSSGKPPEEIYSSWPLTGNQDVHKDHQGKLKPTTGAQAYRLDDFIHQNKIIKMHLIKVDVDGNEEEVFIGAQQSIEKFFPDILMEWSPCLTSETKQTNILSWLLKMDYKVYNGYTGKPIYGGLATLSSMTPESGSINILLSKFWDTRRQ